MIIRSQDKKTILNFDNLQSVCLGGLDSNVVITFADSELVRLGFYSTEEKAIKVLDRIEDVYVNCNCNYVHNDVFQMPQDSEV